MFTGTLSLDLLLGDVHSLKEKRAVVRPIPWLAPVTNAVRPSKFNSM